MRTKTYEFLVMISLFVWSISGSVIAAEASNESSTGKLEQLAPEAYIPFANIGGISDWQVVNDSTLLIQDVHGHWYLAKLQSPAYGLAFANSLGFATAPSGTLEKLSSVVVSGRRYPIVSLTRTDPPAKMHADMPVEKPNPY